MREFTCEEYVSRALGTETQQPMSDASVAISPLVWFSRVFLASVFVAGDVCADESLETLKREIEAVKKRVTALERKTKS
jgi:hypothetical protein